MVPRAVLMKSSLVSINTTRQNISKPAVLVNTAKQVNDVHLKRIVARPMSYLSKIAHSTVQMPFHRNTSFKNSNINQRVNTIRGKKFNIVRPKAVVNVVKGNNVNAVKASTYYEEIDGGYVAFGGNPKGEKITGKFVTDDYSRFTWVLFLATKDETSGILKSFITGIDNLVDHKVKVIRCDNGAEML
ncbi:putative ribonuclease H-like domain-containing protein [Tanacetum coccineum]